MLTTEKNNSLMAAFPHISTTNSGLVWFPMATRPWSSSRFQRILGYWCRYWSCSPCLPGFPVSSETSENQQILHTIKIQQVLPYTHFYNLIISSKYMLSIYLCIHNICGLSIVWKFVQMKLCVLVSVYIKQRLCFHYLLGDLYSLVWSNYQLKYMKIEPPQMFNWVISYYNSSLIPFQSCLKFSELNVLEEIRHIWFIHWRIALPRNQKNMCNIRINGVYDYRQRINFRQNFN